MGRWCFGLKPDDVWWATSTSVGLLATATWCMRRCLAGCTTVVFEGGLDHPHAEANWRRAVEEFGARGIFTVADGNPDLDEVRRRSP